MHWYITCISAIFVTGGTILHPVPAAAQLNHSDVAQIGNGNAAFTNQIGAANRATTIQVGRSNATPIGQTGNGNSATSVQFGSNFDAEIGQDESDAQSVVQQVDDGAGDQTVRSASHGSRSVSIGVGHRGARSSAWAR